MRSFVEVLTESKKDFKFKVKVANAKLPAEAMDRVEVALQAFELVDITKAKSLPVQEYPLLFPSMGPVEVSEFSATVNYPCNADHIKALVQQALRCDSSQVFVLPNGMGEEEYLSELLKKEKNKEAVLTKELEDNGVKGDEHYGQKAISSFLKNLASIEQKFAGDTTPKAKTTNDEPVNTTSPISGKKGK